VESWLDTGMKRWILIFAIIGVVEGIHRMPAGQLGGDQPWLLPWLVVAAGGSGALTGATYCYVWRDLLWLARNFGWVTHRYPAAFRIPNTGNSWVRAALYGAAVLALYTMGPQMDVARYTGRWLATYWSVSPEGAVLGTLLLFAWRQVLGVTRT